MNTIKRAIKSILLCVLFAISLKLSAQLTTRENEEIIVKLGARPQKGDMSLMFAYDIIPDSVKKANLYGGNFLRAGDLLTFKYYLKDDLVFRGGLRLTHISTDTKGAFEDSTYYFVNQINSPGGKSTMRNASLVREYIFVPGIEKHFSKNNFFDVYTGADLFLGFGRERGINNIDFTNGDYSRIKTRMNTQIIGVGGLIGFNMFIAQLPISIGLEYGINALYIGGMKTRINREDRITTGTVTETYSSDYFVEGRFDPTDIDPSTGVPGSGQDQFNQLKNKSFTMETNQNVRITLNLYFGK
ncbi:MAG: hypothetical protein ACK4IK_12470 [Bacteroidia bacterium]